MQSQHRHLPNSALPLLMLTAFPFIKGDSRWSWEESRIVNDVQALMHMRRPGRSVTKSSLGFPSSLNDGLIPHLGILPGLVLKPPALHVLWS